MKGPATSHPSSARRDNPQFPGRCYSSFRGYETRRVTWLVVISETEALQERGILRREHF